MNKTSLSWEALRKWEIVRYLVYYLTENLVPKDLIADKTVVDFSCGIGDLSEYFISSGAKNVISTQPDDSHIPEALASLENITYLNNVQAKDIANHFTENSVDLFVARMVFQFPTVEEHFIDVDGMLQQVLKILKPGGRIIVCTHEYTEVADDPSLWGLDLGTYFEKCVQTDDVIINQKRENLIELIQTIGIPPREGVHGQTGFGLKAIMFLDSIVSHDFTIESCEEIEDFTFPVGLSKAIDSDMTPLKKLAKEVFELKKSFILSEEYQDKYKRPSVRQKLLSKLLVLHDFATMPIFSIQARKAD